MNRTEIAQQILKRLESEADSIKQNYRSTEASIAHFTVDDLLPEELAMKIYRAFPVAASMKLNSSLREDKYVAAQMDRYDPLLEEVLFAFQDPRIVEFIGKLCGIKHLYPDEHLYAGGISRMEKSQFLNPHLDNSHDKDRQRWRVLNLLYYVSPDWQLEDGGNLELWPKGVNALAETVHSKFNRLAVMATHDSSWHSVSPVERDAARCCISNYYFSDVPLKEGLNFHVTTFRGRPEQLLRDIFLRMDGFFRMGIRKIFSRGIIKTNHVYKK